MVKCFKKRIFSHEEYIQKGVQKHTHNYCIEYLLKITCINEHASVNYYNSSEYSEVLKCDLCDSFISKGYIPEKDINYELPLITADTMQKCPIFCLDKLINVKVVNKGVIEYETFKRIFESIKGEPEIQITFNESNDKYWLIKYYDKISYQKEGTNETYYQNLDELYNTILKKDWNNVNDIIIDEMYSFKDDYQDKKYTIELFDYYRQKNSD